MGIGVPSMSMYSFYLSIYLLFLIVSTKNVHTNECRKVQRTFQYNKTKLIFFQKHSLIPFSGASHFHSENVHVTKCHRNLRVNVIENKKTLFSSYIISRKYMYHNSGVITAFWQSSFFFST